MSKYILNKTKTRTANNYKINDITVDLDLNKGYDLNDFNISGDIKNINISKSIMNNFKSEIGLNFDKYYSLNIDIDNNVYINEPIIIEKNIKDGMFINEININIKENSNANFIIKYTSDDNCINFLKQNLNINDNSNCNLSILNFIDNESKSFIEMNSSIKENSNVTYNFIDLGGNLRISNYYSKLLNKNSTSNFNNIYIGKNDDRIDMNFIIENNNIKTNSNINIQGVLDNNSYKSCKATIDFKKDSSKSIGKEHENCILLTDTCKSTSLPMLLCHEEDVMGEHSVSTGKIDKDKLFYLMSKGIEEKEAKKLVINGNFNDIIKNISKTDVIKLIQSEIDKKLN